MFIQDSDLTIALQNTLQKQSLDSFWGPIVTAANQFAYNTIIDRLIMRGYTAAQIGMWDRGVEFQRSLGLFFALTHPAAISAETPYSKEFVSVFDRRDELSGNSNKKIPPCAVAIGGAFTEPMTKYGQVTFGTGEHEPSSIRHLLEGDAEHRL